MTRPFLLVLLIAAPVVLAQSARQPAARDLYHSAAQAYVAGETEQAIRDAERGLALDPDDAKIQRLLDMLRQEKPPQDGDDGRQDDQSEQGDEGEENEQQDQGQNQPERDEAERDETQQNQPQDSEQSYAEDGRDDERRQRNEPSPSDLGQPRPARMSAAEAQRLLDAVAADEELLVEQMRRPSRGRRSDRDW